MTGTPPEIPRRGRPRLSITAKVVEGFFSIHGNAEEKVLGFLSMLKHHALMTRVFAKTPEVKSFLEEHMPIAFEHSGRSLWIDIRSGCIRFMDLDSYREGPVEIAPSFHDFILKFWNNGSGGCPIAAPSSR